MHFHIYFKISVQIYEVEGHTLAAGERTRSILQQGKFRFAIRKNFVTIRQLSVGTDYLIRL